MCVFVRRLALYFAWPECRRLDSATDAIPLPQSKPRTLRKHFVVPAIRSREIARAQRSGVRHCEDALQSLDFGNGLLGVHSMSMIQQKRRGVKRSGLLRVPRPQFAHE
jgi:hypothetical protein